jgi:preprotein translocase subunit YajC
MDWSQLANYIPQAIFVLVMLGMFWWIVIVPAKQRERKHRELIDRVSTGDRVVSAGGIYGTVERVMEKRVELRIADGVVVTLDRRAIVRKQGSS